MPGTREALRSSHDEWRETLGSRTCKQEVLPTRCTIGAHLSPHSLPDHRVWSLDLKRILLFELVLNFKITYLFKIVFIFFENYHIFELLIFSLAHS
jgi:hypothetical protein